MRVQRERDPLQVSPEADLYSGESALSVLRDDAKEGSRARQILDEVMVAYGKQMEEGRQKALEAVRDRLALELPGVNEKSEEYFELERMLTLVELELKETPPN